MAAPETPQGFAAQIHQAIWKPVTMCGAPKIVSVLWLATCLQAALMLLPLAGFRWSGAALVAWCLGQGILIGLTHWEPQWDELVLAQWTRKYRSYYEAG